VKLIHISLGTLGLVVIIGVIIFAVAGDWLTLVAVMALALTAGLITRFAIPREQRLRALKRLSPSVARRNRDQ
jgi:hypothetical protein